MGFTEYEKSELRETLRPDSVTQSLRNLYLPDDVMEYLTSEKWLRQVRDHAIISKTSKLGRPEGITMTYMLDTDTNIYEILQKWQEFFSPPVNINDIFTSYLK